MKILLTRHGETEENKQGILQGWLPGHLSKEGRRQARLLAEHLQNVKIDFIYTSDLLRCVETAKEIAKFHPNAKFIPEKLLRESFEDVWKRLRIFYKKITRKHQKDIILIVGHGGSMCLLQGIILHKSLEESLKLEKLKNTAVSEYSIDGKGNCKIVYQNNL